MILYCSVFALLTEYLNGDPKTCQVSENFQFLKNFENWYHCEIPLVQQYKIMFPLLGCD